MSYVNGWIQSFYVYIGLLIHPSWIPGPFSSLAYLLCLLMEISTTTTTASTHIHTHISTNDSATIEYRNDSFHHVYVISEFIILFYHEDDQLD